jgi:hypothetical protein
VHAEQPPEDGFEPVEPDLEDVYFSTMLARGVPAAEVVAEAGL